MLSHDQLPGRIRCRDEHRAHQWCAVEREGPSELVGSDVIESGEGSGLLLFDVDRHRTDDRHRFREHRMRECRSEVRVSENDGRQRSGQCPAVGGLRECEAVLHVIVVRGTEPAAHGLEVHSPLQRGQRQNLLPPGVLGVHARSGRIVHLDELGTRVRYVVSDRHPNCTIHEFIQGVALEHVGHDDAHPPAGRRCHEPHCGDAVPTESEEVRSHVDLGAEDVTGCGNEILCDRSRCPVAGARARPARRGGDRRRRQARAIELAVQRARQRLDDSDRLRHELIRQRLRQRLPHPDRIGRGSVTDDDVPEEPGRSIRDRSHLRGRVGDLGQRAQRSLDLAELDPEPAHLHLIVGAPQVLDTAAASAYRIARPVQPLPRSPRVGDESGRGQPRSVEVAPRDLGASQVQLAERTFGNLPEEVVENSGSHIDPRSTDRDRRTRGEAVRRGPHRGFRRAVHIPGLVADRGQLIGQFGGHRFTTDQGTRRPHAGHGQEQSPQRRGRLHDRGTGRLDQRGQLLGVHHRRARSHHHGRTECERTQQFQHRDVERHGGHRHHPIVTVDPAQPVRGIRERREVGRGDHDTLGFSGRPRRVDDVGEPVVGDGDLRQHDLCPNLHAGRVDSHRGEVHPSDVVGGRRRHQHADRTCIVEHVLQTIAWIVDIQRQVGGTASQHREQRQRQAGVPADRDPDHRPCAYSARGQRAGERLDAGTGLAIAGLRPVHDDRGGIGSFPDLDQEPLHHRLRCTLAHRTVVGIDTAEHRDRPVRLLDDVGERDEEFVGHVGDRVRIEQIGGAAQTDLGRRSALTEPDGDIHARRRIDRFDGSGSNVTQFDRRTEDFVSDHRLEQRVTSRGAFRCDRVDHTIERHVLVFERVESDSAHAVEHPSGCRITGEVDPVYGGVHQVSDGVPESPVREKFPVGYRGAERNVAARSESLPRQRDRSFEQHQGRHTAPDGCVFQCVRHRAVEQPDCIDRPVRRMPGAGPIGRQLELGRKSGEPLFPVCQRPLGIRRACPDPVCPSELSEIGCDRGQPRSAARQPIPVGLGQGVEQDRHRRAVDCDVVDHDDERCPSASAEHSRPSRHRGCQIEHRVRGREILTHSGVEVDLGAEVPQFRDSRLRKHPHLGVTVGPCGIAGPQDREVRHQVSPCGPQRRRVRGIGQGEHDGDIVRTGLLVHPVQDPQPLLRGRQHRLTGDVVRLRCIHDGGCRGSLCARGECPGRARREDVGDGDDDAVPPQTADRAHRDQRMPATIEEIVVGEQSGLEYLAQLRGHGIDEVRQCGTTGRRYAGGDGARRQGADRARNELGRRMIQFRDHLRDHRRERLDDLRRGRRVHDGRVVVDHETEPIAGRCEQRQRVLRRTDVADTDDMCRVGGVVRVRAESRRIVLEHHQGVEQTGAAAYVAAGFDLGQRQVLRIAEVVLVSLARLQHVTQQTMIHPHAHRNGVAEQAHHRLDPFEVGGPAGHGRTEHDVVAADERAQDGTPRTLHDGVDSEPVRARNLRDLLPECVVHRDLGCHRMLTGAVATGDQGGLRQPGQTPAPCSTQFGAVEPAQPPQEVGIVGCGRQTGRAVGVLPVVVPAVVVDVHQFAQHDRRRPAVGHEVMRIEYELCPPAGEPQHVPRKERSPLHVEDPLGGTQPGLCGGRSGSALRQIPEIGDPPRNLDHLRDRRDGFIDTVEMESGGQVPVTGDDSRERGTQPVGVEFAREVDDRGQDVRVVFGEASSMCEQPLLQRGERQDLGERSGDRFEEGDLALRDDDVIAVDGAQPTGIQRGVGGETAQCILEASLQLRDRRSVEKFTGGGPFDGQHRPRRVVVDERIDRQDLGERAGARLHHAECVTRNRAPVRPRHSGGLSEIVEHDLGRGQLGECRTGIVQESQDPVPDSVVASRAAAGLDLVQDLGDDASPAQRFGQTLVGVDERGRHGHRILGGEPADGRTTIRTRVRVAAVPFRQDREIARCCSPVGAHRDGQRREQHLVRSCPVHRAQGVDDRGGDRGCRVRSSHLRGRMGVDAGPEFGVDEHPRARLQNLTPHRLLVDIAVYGTAGGEIPRAVPPRFARRRRESTTAVGRHKIGQQNAPGHRVDGEVMDHDEQPIVAVGHPNDAHPQQIARPRCQLVGAAPGPGGHLAHEVACGDRPALPDRHGRGGRGGNVHGVVVDDHPQGGMPLPQCLYRSCQRLPVDVAVDLDGRPLRVRRHRFDRVAPQDVAHDRRGRRLPDSVVVDQCRGVVDQFARKCRECGQVPTRQQFLGGEGQSVRT